MSSSLAVQNQKTFSTDLSTRLSTSWTPGQALTTSCLSALPQALGEANAALVPVDTQTLAALLKQTLAIWQSNQPANFKEIASSYLEAFENVPLDLVQSALKHVRLNSKFFPKPAELLDPIRSEMESRKQTLRRLTTMDMLAKKSGQQAPVAAHKPRTEAEKQAAAEAVAKARAILDSATLKKVPTAAGDHRTPAADPYRAAYAFIKPKGDE
jgi:hypothetical protein